MSPDAGKALVLGGKGGFLGQALVKALEAAGWEAEALGRADIDYYSPDVQRDLEAVLDKVKPACIFNTVAYTQVDAAEDDEEAAMALNRSLPAALGRLAKAGGVKLVHFSTDYVFDGKKRSPYTTDDPVNPQSVYGRTKLAGEQALLAMDPPDFCIIRSAWLFGPCKRNFVQTILDLCKKNGSVRVVHDQVGSPTYTADLADYTLKLVELDGKGLFHVANSGQASWCELATEAVRMVQLECPVTPVPSAEFPQKAARPAYSALDCSRFTQVTGIIPRPWPQALNEYLFSLEAGA